MYKLFSYSFFFLFTLIIFGLYVLGDKAGILYLVTLLLAFVVIYLGFIIYNVAVGVRTALMRKKKGKKLLEIYSKAGLLYTYTIFTTVIAVALVLTYMIVYSLVSPKEVPAPPSKPEVTKKEFNQVKTDVGIIRKYMEQEKVVSFLQTNKDNYRIEDEDYILNLDLMYNVIDYDRSAFYYELFISTKDEPYSSFTYPYLIQVLQGSTIDNFDIEKNYLPVFGELPMLVVRITVDGNENTAILYPNKLFDGNLSFDVLDQWGSRYISYSSIADYNIDEENNTLTITYYLNSDFEGSATTQNYNYVFSEQGGNITYTEFNPQ